MFDAQRLVQIGVCVKDLDEAMEYYKKNFGMGPFAIMDSDVEAANYYGRKRPQHNRLALCKLGPVVFELIALTIYASRWTIWRRKSIILKKKDSDISKETQKKDLLTLTQTRSAG